MRRALLAVFAFAVVAPASASVVDLAEAAACGDIAAMERLLAEKADPNALGAACLTPLQAAALGGSMPAVKLLIAHGADPNRRGDGTTSALFHAVYYRRDTMAAYLIEHGAAIDNGNHEDIPFMAADGGLQKTMHLILEYGVHPDDDVIELGTPLIAAVDNHDLRMVAELLAYGADPDWKSFLSDGSPIDHAQRSHQRKIVRMLHAARKHAD